MIDSFDEWKLIDSPPTAFILFDIREGTSGLTIQLQELGGLSRMLEIFFFRSLSLRVVEEEGRSKTLFENDTMGSFNTTKHSEFLSWFNVESQGLFDYKELTHYNIASASKIIDIISGEYPKVKWL
jgi:hypothetical protein